MIGCGQFKGAWTRTPVLTFCPAPGPERWSGKARAELKQARDVLDKWGANTLRIEAFQKPEELNEPCPPTQTGLRRSFRVSDLIPERGGFSPNIFSRVLRPLDERNETAQARFKITLLGPLTHRISSDHSAFTKLLIDLILIWGWASR